MIPLRDDAPRYRTPYITYVLLALNVAAFLFTLTLDGRSEREFVYQFAFIPASLTGQFSGMSSVPVLAAVIPIFTSMFLHAGLWHLLGNMWALWIFGDNIEDYVGPARYLVLYFASGVAAVLLHTAANPHSATPTVGASGALAGVMGAYFVLYPAARVLTLVPFFFIYFVWLPAWLVLGFWFVTQFLSGAAASLSTAGVDRGGIAFWAHVGGFLAGVLMIKLFPPHRRRYHYNAW